MKLFKPAGQEVLRYESDLNIYTLKLQMKERLDKGNKSLPSLQGKFTNQHEFEVWPMDTIAYARKFQRPLPLVYIRGELIPNGNKTTIITQLVPYTAWIPLVFSVVLSLIGFFRFSETNNIATLIVSIFLLLILPFLLLRFIVSRKKELKKIFTQVFGFKHVKDFGDVY